MSRLTSAQVISLGEYLEPDFDPTSLTISQLLGVLGYHNVKYPTPYSKPKLVAVFNEEVKAKAAKLKKERIKKENSIASDDGIVNGATGEPLRKEPITRRASRRLSHAPAQDEDEDLPAPRIEPPKRRRSSAQPTLGGSSRRTTTTQPALIEESEPEEEELPPRKVGRSKKTTEAAGTHSRRVSNPAAEDSGWEDNNIFQSGAESSSPARPSPVRPKAARKSEGPRKSRKSASAPPQMFPSPPRSLRSPEHSRFAPPQSNFEPHLPTVPPVEDLHLNQSKFMRSGFAPPAHHIPVKVLHPKVEVSDDELDVINGHHTFHDFQEPIKEEPTQDFVPEDEDTKVEEVHGSPGPEAQEDQSAAISQQIAQAEKPLVKRRTQQQPGTGIGTVVRVLIYGLLALPALYAVYTFKQESASIGYCDPGSNTNSYLKELRTRRSAVEACNRENSTFLYLPPQSGDADSEAADSTPCPLPPLFPWAYPDSCTPCPEHAKCTRDSVTCEPGYILRPHPLLFFLPASSSPRNTSFSLSSSPAGLIWKVLSEALDGLPGLGSVALPPRCVEDPKRKRNIGVLGKAIESLLGQERGRRVCAGGKVLREPINDVDGGEAKRWGVELENLREVMKEKTPPHLLPTFDDTFNEAIQQLIQWGGVVIGEDRSGLRYVAHKTPDLTWDCVITVKAREIWAEWRATVFAVALVIIGLFLGRARTTQKREEAKRVAELVQIALDTLRNQELAHHTDPVTVSQPYLSSLQLRDLILQDEHSVASRSKLWDQVERVVEGNANVRANLQEMNGGDEMRVWRWVGSAGHGTPIRKQVPSEPVSGHT
ncbi:putative man1-Src1p-C-terminal domain containing protein [Lyophyllum shimeji]|uniref:Man1-Src1p-C-terminal domain containing protein n=1 Tax=Lyophyllum shimeji TaxID=47721 RepID=A0A9P3UKX7_LYOSH|nr:putative man1-Src1p-C-terminal domain containing protein [Lyophyllum shimeji]